MTRLPFDPPAPNPPERLSMSFLRAAGECLLGAKLARDLGDPSGPEARVGHFFHEAAATIGFAAIMRGLERVPVEEALAITRRVLARPEDPDPLSPAAYFDVLELVASWAGRVTWPADADYAAVELSYRHRAPSGHVLSARIDRLAVYGSFAEVIDYKTGRPRASDDFDPDRPETRPQLPQYAWHVAQEHPDVQTFQLTEDYVRWGGPTSIIMTRDQVERFGGYLDVQAQRVHAIYADDAIEPTPGSWCRNCVAPQRCPLPEELRPESVQDVEDAVDAASALLVLDARRGKLTKALRAFTREHGNVVAGDREVGYFDVTTNSVDPELLAAAGIDLDSFRRPEPGRKFDVRKAGG